MADGWVVWPPGAAAPAVAPGVGDDVGAVAAGDVLAVRAGAWEAVGGAHERLRAGAGADLRLRLHAAGWTVVGEGPRAPEGLRAAFTAGAGARWLRWRHPGTRPAAPSRPVARLAFAAGRLAASSAAPEPEPARRADGRPPEGVLDIAVLAAQAPQLSETFVLAEARALQARGHRVRLEARGRGSQPSPGALGDLPAAWVEDDSPLRRLADFAWLVVRHPLRTARDRRFTASFAQEQGALPLRLLAPVARRLARAGRPHLHVHFADVTAVDGLRLGRLLGTTVSLTAHAYEIYGAPRDLRRKLRCATFTTSGCAYTVRDLREVIGPDRADDVHVVVMGVDAEAFRRAAPLPGRSTVVAVGRLVEKKGFAHLIDALATPPGAAVRRLLVVGSGPLREALEARARERGVAERLTFLGARAPSGVREVLEEADVLAMPCVVAADGDRDSMPVVVKEALAMEVLVVASDEVGLPEIVRAPWGRLAPPGDAAALATALAEMLALGPQERERAGAAGRAFVQEHCDVHREAGRLSELIAGARARA
ncbi:MAG TPA: glycosyltransferase [Baekduia sp.]|nr:glycosyltransferase [Baekduia sp.]